MPQMAPIWWATLFMIFMTTYLITMTNIYFFKPQKKKMNSDIKNIPLNQLNWLW